MVLLYRIEIKERMYADMNKRTSNNLFILLLAVITMIVVGFILSAIGINSLFSFIVGLIVGIVLYTKFMQKQRPAPARTDLKDVSSEREKIYKSRGLSDEDITFFRDTMNKAKNQIIEVEDNMESTGKLRAIANRNNTIQLIKVLFKDIVNEPERLHEIDQFLYVHLPSLADLSNKYVRINEHQAKSKQTFDILEKSALTIDEMCKQITDDYMKFRETDINQMADEVEFAKRRLNREGSSIIEDEI